MSQSCTVQPIIVPKKAPRTRTGPSALCVYSPPTQKKSIMNNKFASILCVFVVLSVCLFAEPTPAFDIRKVNWGMSVSEVKKAEKKAVLQHAGKLIPFGPVLVSLWYADPGMSDKKSLQDGDLRNFCYVFHYEKGGYRLNAVRFYVIDRGGIYLYGLKQKTDQLYGRSDAFAGIYAWHVPDGRTSITLHSIDGKAILMYADRKYEDRKYGK